MVAEPAGTRNAVTVEVEDVLARGFSGGLHLGAVVVEAGRVDAADGGEASNEEVGDGGVAARVREQHLAVTVFFSQPRGGLQGKRQPLERRPLAVRIALDDDADLRSHVPS